MRSDCLLHRFVADFLRGGCLHLRVEEVDHLVDTRAGAGVRLRCDEVIAVVRGRTDRLRSVLGKTEDVGGVQRVRTRVNGIEINIIVEQHVFHRQRLSVGEFDAVLQHEVVGHGIVLVLDDLVILDNDGFVVAVCHLHFAVDILRTQHTDLRHTDDRTVGSRGVEKRVEQAVKLFGHNDKGVTAVFGTARQSRTHSDAQRGAQNEGQPFSFHVVRSFYI